MNNAKRLNLIFFLFLGSELRYYEKIFSQNIIIGFQENVFEKPHYDVVVISSVKKQ